MKTLCIITLMTMTAFGQIGVKLGDVKTEVGRAPQHTTITHERERLLVSEDGRQQFRIARHDLVKPSLELLSVKRSEGKYTYTYRLANGRDALEPINQLVFYVGVNEARTNTGSEIWFDAGGVKAGSDRLITINSEFGPKKTTAFIMNFDVGGEVERLERHENPAPLTADFIEHIERASDVGNDSVRVDVVGPLK